MGGRDHSIECETCGLHRGGLNDLQCDCDGEQNATAYSYWTRANNLASNLTIGAALCRAYYLGAIEAASSMKYGAHHDQWFPGCQRSAP